MKLSLRFFLLALSIVLTTHSLKADHGDEGKDKAAGHGTTASKLEPKTIDLIKKVIPQHENTDWFSKPESQVDKKYLAETLDANKKFDKAWKDMDTKDKNDAITGAKPLAAFLADFVRTIDTKDFDDSWKHLNEHLKKFDKNAKSLEQDEVLAKGLKMAFELWNEKDPKKPSDKDPNSLFALYIALKGDKDKKVDSEVAKAKEKGDEINKLTKQLAEDKRQNDDPNRQKDVAKLTGMIGKGVLDHGTPEKKAEMAMALRQWVPNQNGGQPVLLMNNAEGKLIGVDLPKDMKTLEKAMASGQFKGWTPVGALGAERIEKFKQNQESIPIQEWANGAWKPKTPPTAVAAGGTQPQTGPKEPAPKTGQTSGGGSQPTEENKGTTPVSTTAPAAQQVEALISSGKCSGCHASIEMSGGQLMINGKVATAAGFRKSLGKMNSLATSEKEAIRAFLAGPTT